MGSKNTLVLGASKNPQRYSYLAMQKLKAHEIKKLADVVKNDPVKTSFAKKALGL